VDYWLDQRTAVPPLAERARTLTARSDTTAVLLAAGPGRAEPALHYVHHDGSTVLLLAASHSLVTLLEPTPHREVSAMIELTDTAPIELRQPVRGLLWITGWLRLLCPRQARRVALKMVEHRCDERLLDLDCAAKLLWLHPEFALFSDTEGIGWLSPADLVAAASDPLCHLEQAWHRHLDQDRPDVLHALGRHVFPIPHGEPARVRPLGVDRLGVRLRIENGEQARDFRLPFQRPVTTPVQLAIEVHRLAGCPVVTLGHRPLDVDYGRRT
jgi:hypothetical protein